MNTEDLESRFKAEEDPFRLVIVCAMWITGFDVPSLSTMYIDKPLKAHTLMQTIARANRINTGKNNGLIVDYIETYKALLDALAIYGKGDEEGGTGEITDPPVKPNDELIKQLEEALSFTEVFLKDEVNFDLNYLISSVGLHKIAALEKAINAVYTTDETKIKFQVLAREVFKKFKALQPHKILNTYAPAKNAISVIYDAIEDKIESADVSEIMKKIQDVVDESISNMVSEPKPDDYNIIDLSSLNFELLKEYFLKAQNKNILIQSLKEKIEKKLKHIVDRNPLQVDFYARYQEIIDEYNRGKDVVTIEETFRKLMEFINSMSAEEAETKREGLTDEYKAIFDILRHGKKLNEKEKVKVKELSVSLLEELKTEKLCAAQWSDKSATSAAVYNFVNKTLFEELPYPTYQNNDVELMTQMIFNHLKTQYYGGGQSVYGNY
jgi:type I restriction enzyme R subunit